MNLKSQLDNIASYAKQAEIDRCGIVAQVEQIKDAFRDVKDGQMDKDIFIQGVMDRILKIESINGGF